MNVQSYLASIVAFIDYPGLKSGSRVHIEFQWLHIFSH